MYPAPASPARVPQLMQVWRFIDPPHIEDSGQPAELSLTPGAPLELRCDARGTPLPSITWHKDGQALSIQEDNRGTGQRLWVEAVQVLLSCAVGEGEGPSSIWRGLAELLLCVG